MGPGLYCSILPASILIPLMTSLIPRSLDTRLFQYTPRMCKMTSKHMHSLSTGVVSKDEELIVESTFGSDKLHLRF